MSVRRASCALVLAALGGGWVAAPAPAAPPRLVGAPSKEGSWTARVIAPTFARAKPWESRRIARVRPQATWGGGVVRLMVLDSVQITAGGPAGRRRLWLRVALPIRPNQTSGWIPADYVQLARITWRVEISRKRRTVRVLHRGRQVRRFRAVVGAPATPTPTGLFAIDERIRQADPAGFVGPWALHLTAFSDVLDNYGGGPGRVAIHGRAGASLSDPLGTARSHGCIRVANTEIRRLARTLPVGTPVRITP